MEHARLSGFPVTRIEEVKNDTMHTDALGPSPGRGFEQFGTRPNYGRSRQISDLTRTASCGKILTYRKSSI